MKKNVLALVVAIAMSMAGAANAAIFQLTHVSTTSQSANGKSEAILSDSTATWTYDTDTTLVTSTTGLYVEHTQANQIDPGQMYTRHIAGLVAGNGAAASGISFACIEGSFGGLVGANLCGNYTLGVNTVDDSTTSWGPGTAFSRTMGGDDVIVGPMQTIAEYDGMVTFDTGTQIVITNANPGVGGQTMVFDIGAVVNPVDAADDTFNVLQNTGMQSLPVGANDSNFADNVTATISVIPDQLGTALPNASSPGPHAAITIDYIPAIGFSGQETFTYQIEDANTDTDTAVVTINVRDAGANDDIASTHLNTALAGIPVGTNDFGFTDPVTVLVTAPPDAGGGINSINGSGGPVANVTIGYIPSAPLGTPTYTETFTYQITDSSLPNAIFDTAVVTVTVNNEVPNAVPANAILFESSSVDTDISALAGINLGDAPSTITVTAAPTNGMTSVAGSVITYTPTPLFFGGDSYDYTILDDDGEISSATVSVTVKELPPGASDDTASTHLNTALSGIPVGLNDKGFIGAVTVLVTAAPDMGGTIDTINGNGGLATDVTIDYTPAISPLYTVTYEETFTYQVTDSNTPNFIDTAIVTVTVNNEIPNAVPADVAVVENGSTDTDIAGLAGVNLGDAPSTIAVTVVPTNGSTTVVGSVITYTPDASFLGGDSYEYTITDDDGETSTDTISVTVNPAPSANDDTAATNLNTPIVGIPIGMNDTDFTDPVSVIVTALPDANGTINAINGSDGPMADVTIDYTPFAPLFTATYTETFTYQVTDVNNLVDTAVVTVTINNAIPNAVSTDASAAEDGSVATNVAGLAGADLGDAPSTVTVSTAPMRGLTTVAGSVITYTPDAFYVGDDSYDYLITDNDNETSMATVSVTVGPALVPTANGNAATINQDDTVDIDVTANDMPGSGSLAMHTVTVTTAPSIGRTTVSATNVITYTPKDGFFGTDSFVYTLEDEDKSDSDTATVTITINEEPPTELPGGSSSSAIDPWSLSLLLIGLPALRRRCRQTDA